MEISSKKSTPLLNQTAALLLAAAVSELFPDTSMIGGQGTPDYFYQDFVFPFEFKPEFLPLIEERMRLIIREKRGVRSFEMMPSNAAELMRHHHQTIVAEQLKQIQRATVEMGQIGDFIAFFPQTLMKGLSIPFFKVLEGDSREVSVGKATRIIGAACDDKETLKQIAKQPSISSQSHLKLAPAIDFCAPMGEEGMWYWCPKGEQVRQQWIEWWRAECVKQNFDLIASPTPFIDKGGEESISHSHREYFLRFGKEKIAEMALISNGDYSDLSLGLFSPKTFFGDRIHRFCSDEKLLEECISSLPFILKIPKILGFKFEIVLSVSSEGAKRAKAKGALLLRQVLEKTGLDYTLEKEYRVGTLASIDIQIADSLGRRWTGPFLRIPDIAMPIGKGSMVILSAFGSLERMCALLLEKNQGWLPFWLAPQQVRILVANDKTDLYAKRVYETLNTQGFRVAIESGKEPLKARLYRAIVEKVPYILLLGEREERGEVLTIRTYGGSEEQTLSLDEFCIRLKREMGSGNSELKN
ncbi:MAG: His/Gly/Thr/Pro-type tRNA ligase C-terminal domain-containing protein [Rhabdochlamydiaceae bacterium]|jgi:threonyl-tRNA synthetase